MAPVIRPVGVAQQIGLGLEAHPPAVGPLGDRLGRAPAGLPAASPPSGNPHAAIGLSVGIKELQDPHHGDAERGTVPHSSAAASL